MRASWWHPVKRVQEHRQATAFKRSQAENRSSLWRQIDNTMREQRSAEPFHFKPQGSGIKRLLPPHLK